MQDARLLGVENGVPSRSRALFPFLPTCVLITVLAFILLPSYLHRRAAGQLAACKSNQAGVAKVLEVYCVENSGNYPDSLEKLVQPNYLRTIPTCPAAGKMTFLDYRTQTQPASYSFGCCGNNHWLALVRFDKPNVSGFPRHHSELGLIERP